MVRVFAILFFLLISISSRVYSQQKYWVFFHHKSATTFDPVQYFAPEALQRRILNGLDVYDSTDMPVNKAYISTILSLVDSVGIESRWFNAISVYATNEQIANILQLSFVTNVQSIHSFGNSCVFDTLLTNTQARKLRQQQMQMGANQFSRKKINGKGIIIAVFDVGFEGVNKSPVFGHLFDNKQIIATWDFVRNREDVYLGGTHGTSVLSCLAGMARKRPMGFASGARYLLARTEVKQEIKAEEDYWIAAMEWADKNGAHIINSSLGYTYHRYFTDQMDGQTSMLSRAANMAAHKGMLVVNAMGNDGDNEWKIMGVPADADSVLSVGAVESGSLLHAQYSSFGPTWDKRMKPNVCALGTAIVADDDGFVEAKGTSFATPFVSGFAACVWQMNPNMTNMQVKSAIELSGSLYPYFDYAHGYGIPQADFFLSDSLLTEPLKTFTIFETTDSLHVIVFPEYISRKLNKFNYLYYHIENNEHYLSEYAVIEVDQEKAFSIEKSKLKHGDLIRFYYKDYLVEYRP